MPPLTVLEVVSDWEGGYRCRVGVRDFEIVADEPPSVGGTDAGPTPTELFLSSLAVCFTMAVRHAARKRDIELPDLSIKVSGTYEGLKFARIDVEAHSSYPRDALEKLLKPAVAYCYVSSTLLHKPDMEFTAVHRAPLSPG